MELFSQRIRDAWTPALIPLPRWLEEQGYEDVGDSLTPPDLGLPVLAPTQSSSGFILPASWVLTTGSVLPQSFIQGFLFALSEELSWQSIVEKSVSSSRSLFFDLADPSSAFYANGLPLNGSIEVQLDDGSWYPIRQVSSDTDLFFSPDWVCIKKEDEALIYGIGIIEESVDGGWYTLTAFDDTSLAYFKHPATQSWVPVHPTDIREDGVVGFTGTAPTQIRTFSKTASDSLYGITIRCNDIVTTAKRVNLWTSLDEKGLWYGLDRLDGESATSFSERLLQASWFGGGQTPDECRNFIAAGAGTGVVDSVPRFSDSIDLTGYDGITIRNIPRLQVVTEPLVYDSGIFRTRYINPVRGTVFYDGNSYDVTSSNGIATIDAINYIEGKSIVAVWLLSMWSVTTDALTFSDSMPAEGPDYVVLKTEGVEVPPAPDWLLGKSYTRTWPTFKWGGEIQTPVETEFALAVFE